MRPPSRLFAIISLTTLITLVVSPWGASAQTPAVLVCDITMSARGTRFAAPDSAGQFVNRFKITRDDDVVARIRFARDPAALKYRWEFVELSKRPLSDRIVVIDSRPALSPTTSPPPMPLTEQPCAKPVVHQIVLSDDHEPGRAYTYALRYVDSTATGGWSYTATQVAIQIVEDIHIEVTTGPLYSGARRTAYELASGKTSAGDAYTEIVERDPVGRPDLVAGATFRPWGYDPRGLSPRNVLFFLGLALTDKPLENGYLGIGFGGRGFNLIGGVHAYLQTRLRDGFTAGQRNPGIGAIGEVTDASGAVAPFLTAQVDVATFGRLFRAAK